MPPPYPENTDAPQTRKGRQGGRSNAPPPYLEIPDARDLWPMVPYCSAYRCWLLFGLLSALAMPGCSHKGEVGFTAPGSLRASRSSTRRSGTSSGSSGSPASSKATSKASVYPKPTAYIQKWIVDIGDKVRKGDVLAILFARADRGG